MIHKVKEVKEEIGTFFSGKNSPFDAIILPIVFVMLSRMMPLLYASIIAVSLSVGMTIYRIVTIRRFIYPLYGLVAVLLAIYFVFYLGSAEGYFLPLIIKDALLGAIAFVSIALKRPLVALFSSIPHGWPLGWYLHPDVRPAYAEVTLLWSAFFMGRSFLYYALVLKGNAELLTTINTFIGWPGIFMLFVASYLYGTWRLKKLGGPSVSEFTRGKAKPWASQQRGF